MTWHAKSRRDVGLVEKQDRIEDVLRSLREEIPPVPPHLPWEVRKILAYIHQHLFEQDLNAAAARLRCRLHNNNISTRFRYTVGIGLREYIEAGRLEAAKRLLGHPDLEIYLVAVSVGYRHHETFCRAFQRREGCAPSEYRETIRGVDLDGGDHERAAVGHRYKHYRRRSTRQRSWSPEKEHQEGKPDGPSIELSPE